MKREEAKKELRELIEKFRREEKQYKSSSEANIETKLVEELFINILGWEKDDFSKQDRVFRGDKRGRADYGFRLGEKIIFYLEVKKVNVPLEKEADKQVVSYALSKKNVSFAISTNFRQLKVFCVEQEKATDSKNIFKVFLEPEEYLSKFDDLWLLSKESFRENLLLIRAQQEGRLKKRVSIDKYLLEDLMYVRKLISDDIEKRYSSKYNINEKDEIVQRILDRLIFIRRCEDIGINPNEIALSDTGEEADDGAYRKLKQVFEIYNEKYNSGLFAIGEDNDCDKIIISGKIIKNLVKLLYQSRDGEYYYNFDWIDADVLGQVYEQYLGKILSQTKTGKAKLKEGQAHRKEQGIYYTPTYIVDYIVKNTLGEKIKENRKNVKNLKILDPACGSGSFLIKAFDYLYDELKDEEKAQRNLSTIDTRGFYSKKTEILKNNLFGVDLDNKAVEITKLNLLLKAAEKNRKLPEELDLHIRKGNSLIADEEITKDFFKWEDDFAEGSFDVVIGNPPYVFGGNSGIKNEEKEFFKKDYYSGKNKLNLFSLFIEKSINILKPKGIMGFIVPNTLLRVTSYEEIRKYILEKTKILQIINLEAGVFEGVTASTIIILLQKEDDKNLIKKNKIQIYNGINGKKEERSQSDFLNNLHIFDLGLEGNQNPLYNKISEKTIKLGSICKEMIFGVVITKNKDEVVSNIQTSMKHKKFLEGKDIDRYRINFSNKYLLYEKSKLHRARTPKIFEVPEKILVQRISGGKRPLKAAYDNENYYNKESINNIIIEDKDYNTKYILALLNSNLMNWIYSTKFTNASTLTVNISKAYLSLLPIRLASLTQQQKIIVLVDKILDLNKKLVAFGDKQTSETKRLKDEIEKIDRQINEEVYKLYGITDDEKKIIEESLK